MENNEKRNYIRLCMLVLDFGRDTLVNILKQKTTFKDITNFLDTNKNYLKKRLSYSKRQLLYPREKIHEGSFYKNLDFNLLCILLKGILKDEQESLTYIETLCKAKNALFRNPKGVHLNTETFEKTWILARKAVQFLCSDYYLREDIFLKLSEIYDLQIELDEETREKEDTVILKSMHEDFETQTWPTKRAYKMTRQTEKYLQISELVFNVGSDVFRALLFERLPPSILSTKRVHILHDFPACQDLKLEISLERKYKEEKEIEPWHCYDSFDFSLLYHLIRRLGNIPQHSKSWGKQPIEKDFSMSANIDRLNGVKQKLMNNRLGTSLSEKEFEDFKHEALCAIHGIWKRLPGFRSVQGKIDEIFKEKTSLVEIANEEERSKGKLELGRSTSQPASLARLDNSTGFSGLFDHQSLKVEETTLASSTCQNSHKLEETFNKFKIRNKDKLFKCFLGHDAEKLGHDDIFIMAYLKQTLTKTKYWDKFENMNVLYVDCNFVGTEAAEAMYSEKAMKNPIEFEKMEEIKKIIGENSDELMTKHSNLEIISASPVISRKGEIFVEPCIVLYCRTKGVIPVGEGEFPEKLGEYSTDVREGFFQWAPGDDLYPAPNVLHNPLKMGCNIGLSGKRHSGTLGGFVDTRKGISFVTCAHVLYDQDDLKKLAGPRSDDFVVQPADGQLTDVVPADNRTCGKVLKFSFDPDGRIGVDAAVVSIIDRKPTQGEFTGLCQRSLAEAGFDITKPLRYNSGSYRRLNADDMDRRVIKSGATTGLTRGTFKFHGATIKVFDVNLYLDPSAQKRTYPMKGQLEITGLGTQVFAQPGDSGSFVFLVEGDRSLTCIGMVEGFTTYYSTIVTPITAILQKLELENMELYSFSSHPEMES